MIKSFFGGDGTNTNSPEKRISGKEGGKSGQSKLHALWREVEIHSIKTSLNRSQNPKLKRRRKNTILWIGKRYPWLCVPLFPCFFCGGGHATLYYKARIKRRNAATADSLANTKCRQKNFLVIIYFLGAAAAISFARNNGWHSGIGGGGGGKFSLSYQQQNSQTFFWRAFLFPPKNPTYFYPFHIPGEKLAAASATSIFPVRERINSSSLFTRNRRRRRRKIPSPSLNDYPRLLWRRHGNGRRKKNLLAWSKTNAIFLLFPTTQLIIISGKSLSPFKWNGRAAEFWGKKSLFLARSLCRPKSAISVKRGFLVLPIFSQLISF